MTTLATTSIIDGQLDMLALVADESTPLGKLHAADFRLSCESVADDDGWVNPNLVAAHLRARFGDINPRAYSAMWAGACGKNGFMDTHRDVLVPIDGTNSRGNSNKSVPMRRLRDH
jgi:hypothetical protein